MYTTFLISQYFDNFSLVSLFASPLGGEVLLELYKLTDFSVSRFLNEASLAPTLAGTSGYYAPEVFSEKHHARCDVFSLGVALLECALGQYAFSQLSKYGQNGTTKEWVTISRTAIMGVIDLKLRKLVIKMLAFDSD